MGIAKDNRVEISDLLDSLKKGEVTAEILFEFAKNSGNLKAWRMLARKINLRRCPKRELREWLRRVDNHGFRLMVVKTGRLTDTELLDLLESQSSPSPSVWSTQKSCEESELRTHIFRKFNCQNYSEEDLYGLYLRFKGTSSERDVACEIFYSGVLQFEYSIILFMQAFYPDGGGSEKGIFQKYVLPLLKLDEKSEEESHNLLYTFPHPLMIRTLVQRKKLGQDALEMICFNRQLNPADEEVRQMAALQISFEFGENRKILSYLDLCTYQDARKRFVEKNYSLFDFSHLSEDELMEVGKKMRHPAVWHKILDQENLGKLNRILISGLCEDKDLLQRIANTINLSGYVHLVKALPRKEFRSNAHFEIMLMQSPKGISESDVLRLGKMNGTNDYTWSKIDEIIDFSKKDQAWFLKNGAEYGCRHFWIRAIQYGYDHYRNRIRAKENRVYLQLIGASTDDSDIHRLIQGSKYCRSCLVF